MFELLRKFRARDINRAFADPELNIQARINEMVKAGVPWEVIIALVIQLIQAWLGGKLANTEGGSDQLQQVPVIGKGAPAGSQPPTAEQLTRSRGKNRPVDGLEVGGTVSQEQHDEFGDTAVPENKAAYDGEKPGEDGPKNENPPRNELIDQPGLQE